MASKPWRSKKKEERGKKNTKARKRWQRSTKRVITDNNIQKGTQNQERIDQKGRENIGWVIPGECLTLVTQKEAAGRKKKGEGQKRYKWSTVVLGKSIGRCGDKEIESRELLQESKRPVRCNVL